MSGALDLIRSFWNGDVDRDLLKLAWPHPLFGFLLALLCIGLQILLKTRDLKKYKALFFVVIISMMLLGNLLIAACSTLPNAANTTTSCSWMKNDLNIVELSNRIDYIYLDFIPIFIILIIIAILDVTFDVHHILPIIILLTALPFLSYVQGLIVADHVQTECH